ncbi:MAG TPA: hypothetical protein VFX59_25645 [Polyangiales bacterium]|nr:hypothetical protein [Polyangiales bacterium]
MKPVAWIVVGGGLALGGAALVRWMMTPSAGGPYSPNASEVPIREDYEGTAERVVRPDNYKAQLTKIEKDLLDLSRKDP